MSARSILDLYHGDDVDIAMLAQNGVSAIILKATQGLRYVDPTFVVRARQTFSAGLLRGSYHFATGDDPILQVQHWLATAMPNDEDALALDWEKNPIGSSASYADVCAMVVEVQRHTGRYPLLYGSNFLHEQIPAVKDSVLFRCPLWIAGYNAAPKIPRGWAKYTLWQYTGDDQGPLQPHIFPGADNPLDVSQFDGTLAALREQWPFTGGAP